MIQPYKTIIIDDEPPAIQRLKELTAQFPGTFDIIGQALSGREGLDKIRELKPDLIFLDIQMPGMTGFEMLQNLEKIPIVIFCTAFDHYSLKAFETNSIDYLVKPVKLERLMKTAEKISFFSRESQRTEIMLDLLKEVSLKTLLEPVTSITVRHGSSMIFVKIEDIAFFKADEKYVSLFTRQGKEVITEQTLQQLEEKLPGNFLRIHRSILLNTSYVREVQTYFNCRYIFLLNDYLQSKVISGRSYQPKIKEWMGI